MEEQGNIIKTMVYENEAILKNNSQSSNKESSKYVGISSILNLKRKNRNKN